MRRILAVWMIWTLCAATAGAQDAPLRQITVLGEGQVTAPPDMAMITLGVTMENEAAHEAMAATSAAVSQILARLNELGQESRDIQTRQITLNPIWRNERYDSGKAPEIAGFTATNTIAIRVHALDQLGDVLDAVIEDGANTFNGLRFSVSDPEPLLNEARRRAVADAMARAALLAEAAGVTLGAVQTITEQGGQGAPMMMEMQASRSASDAIATGEVTFGASVTMVFSLTSP